MVIKRKCFVLLITRLNDSVKDRGLVPVLLSWFRRSWGNMCGVMLYCMGFNSLCAFMALYALYTGFL